MLEKYNRLIENSIHFVQYVNFYFSNNKQERSILNEMTINQFHVDQVKLANGFQIQLINNFSGDQNDIQYLCLSQDQNQEDRIKLRDME